MSQSPTSATGTSFATDGFATSSDGTRIHYTVVGEGGPALVCCDGLGCDGYVWRYIAEAFAPSHRIIRFQYRAHGQSQAPGDPERMRVADLCEDLGAVLDATGVSAAILLGHSVGAQVIFEFQRRFPERVLGLVPLCGTYGRVTSTFRDSPMAAPLFPHIARAATKHHRLFQKIWKLFDTEMAYQIALRGEVNGNLVRRDDFRPYLAHLAKMDVRHFFRLAMDAGQNDNLEHLASIRIPTLIIAGEHDVFTPHWLSQVMHARIHGSELLTIPGGTHTAPIEMPDIVTMRLARWLEERFGRQTQSSAA